MERQNIARKENMKEIKRTMAGIRKDLQLTQIEMANKLNIPIATYQRYETGKTPIPIDIAIKIADYGNIVDLRDIKFY